MLIIVELRLPMTAGLKSSMPLTRAIVREMKNKRTGRFQRNEKRRFVDLVEGFIARLRAKTIDTA